MNRDYRFDVARVLSMSFIVVITHLYGYIYNVKSAYYIPECAVVTDACLGLFTFISGYLIGNKYIFSKLRWGGRYGSSTKNVCLELFPSFCCRP